MVINAVEVGRNIELNAMLELVSEICQALFVFSIRDVNRYVCPVLKSVPEALPSIAYVGPKYCSVAIDQVVNKILGDRVYFTVRRRWPFGLVAYTFCCERKLSPENPSLTTF